MRKIISGECSSNMLTRSASEGLFAPAFCALIVSNVRFVPRVWASVGASTVTSLSSPRGVESMSLCVGFMEREASIGCS